jgi:murein DD-endopeptidase MepM/ murein hydrolase activator NlpD
MYADNFETPSKSTFWKLRNEARLLSQPWHSPLSRLATREPLILREYATDTRRGIELGYEPRDIDSQLYVPVYAAQLGEISAALDTPTGYAISIEHSQTKTVTHYAHLSKMLVTPCLPKRRCRQFVQAGQVIGYAATSPVHIRFELWRWTSDRGYVADDPIPELASWKKALTQFDLRALTQEAA